MKNFCDDILALQRLEKLGSIVMKSAGARKASPERVLALGDEQSLIAITTEASPASTKPTVLLLNAGVLHRVGPRRLHVTLARTLAGFDVQACRVDLSGIGDSRNISSHASFRDSAVADTRALMDHLAATNGKHRFVLFGLCSGADNALAVAAADPRIVGLVLIDAPSYATYRSLFRKFVRRMSRSTPTNIVAAAIGAAFRTVANALRSKRASQSSGGRKLPSRGEFRRQLNQLVARGVHILCIYTAAMHERYNDKQQLFELYPELRDRVEVEYFGTADHVFTELKQQQRLIETVASWVERTYS